MKYANMVYLVSEEKVLMLKKDICESGPNSGYFTFPGGKLNEDEKGLGIPFGRLESAIREIQEETGIEIFEPLLKGIILFDNSEREFDNWKNLDNFIVYIYSAKNYKGKLKKGDEGIPYLIPLDKIKEIPSNQGDKLMYDWLADGRKFFGVIYHKGKQLDESKTFIDWF